MLQAPPSRRNPYEVAAEKLEKNPWQWTAYTSTGNFVALAGPGSGKTKVLTLKLARILHEEDFPEDHKIACITYNNECVRELERRLRDLGIEPDDRRLYLGTAHSFCLTQILRPLGRLADVGLPARFAVAPRSQREALLDQCLARFNLSVSKKNKSFIQASRRSAIDRAHMEKRADRGNAMAKAILEYEGLLHGQGLIDFEDMVIFGARIVHKHAWARTALHAQFPVLMVDEYQDLGLPLHEIVMGLCVSGRTRLFAVGDPDQSIYGFTGAYPKLLLELTKQSGIAHTRLPFNYRCATAILDTSVRVLGEPREYTSKADYDGSVQFHPVDGTVPDQAEYITSTLLPAIINAGYKPGDIAILYRSVNEGKYVGAELESAAYYTVRIGRNSHYEKTALTRWLEDCAAFCAGGWRSGRPPLTSIIRTWHRLNSSIQDEEARAKTEDELVHVLYEMRDTTLSAHDWLQRVAAGVVRATLARESELEVEKESLDDLIVATRPGGPLAELDLRRFADQGGSPDHINLLTLHSCKGREFPVVILVGMDEGIVPGWNDSADPDALKEARRLFYVGITRAMKDVHVVHSEANPSRFISELFAPESG